MNEYDKYDLTVDEIHNIRVENSKRFESMTRDEIKAYYAEQDKIFDDSKRVDNLVFA